MSPILAADNKLIGGLDSTSATFYDEADFSLNHLEAVLKILLGFKVEAGPSVQPL